MCTENTKPQMWRSVRGEQPKPHYMLASMSSLYGGERKSNRGPSVCNRYYCNTLPSVIYRAKHMHTYYHTGMEMGYHPPINKTHNDMYSLKIFFYLLLFQGDPSLGKWHACNAFKMLCGKNSFKTSCDFIFLSILFILSRTKKIWMHITGEFNSFSCSCGKWPAAFLHLIQLPVSVFLCTRIQKY